MVLVAVVVVTVTAFAVFRLHGIFGSHNNVSASSDISNEVNSYNPKHVIFEVFGAPGTVATINYLDLNAQPQRVDKATLPWSYKATTTKPSVFGNLVAQGDSTMIGCRIIINGVVKSERIANEVNAYTFCLDKSG
jgi:hypothetical protein